MTNVIKLSEYAKRLGITYKTAWNRYKKGLLNTRLDETGHVYVILESGNRAITYSRVSSNSQKNDLVSQNSRLKSFVISSPDLEFVRDYKEVASGMNDSRKVLIKLFDQSATWDVLVVENRDRLTRFGFNYIEKLLNLMGKSIIVLNENDNQKEDLMQDLISIFYSFSARMYGLRRRKTKSEVEKVIEDALS